MRPSRQQRGLNAPPAGPPRSRGPTPGAPAPLHLTALGVGSSANRVPVLLGPATIGLSPALSRAGDPQRRDLLGPLLPRARGSLPGTERRILHFSDYLTICLLQLFQRCLPVLRSGGGTDTDAKLMHAGGLERTPGGPRITRPRASAPRSVQGLSQGVRPRPQTYPPEQTGVSCSTQTPGRVLSQTGPNTSLTVTGLPTRLGHSGHRATAIPALPSGGRRGAAWGSGFPPLNSALQGSRLKFPGYFHL